MVLVYLGLVVWLSSALAVGVKAESTGRNPWAWFGVTLVFGVFALLVYWATNPPREEDKYHGEWSFKAFTGYISTVFGSIIFGFGISIMVVLLVGHMETYSDRSQSIAESIVLSGILLSMAVGVVVNLLRRHLTKEKLATFPKGVSASEFRIIGALSILLALPIVSVSRTLIFQSYTLTQSFVGILFVFSSISVIVISVWSLELGRPISGLYDYISNSIN